MLFFPYHEEMDEGTYYFRGPTRLKIFFWRTGRCEVLGAVAPLQVWNRYISYGRTWISWITVKQALRAKMYTK